MVEDILVLTLLSVMVTVGMVMFFGGLAGLAINGYRSMRRSRTSEASCCSAGAEAERVNNCFIFGVRNNRHRPEDSPMIENEEQYRVTQEREQTFSQLVHRMETEEAQSILGENPVIRQAKLDATRSILQELREELRDWESRPLTDASGTRHTA